MAALGLMLSAAVPPTRGQGNPNPGIIPVNKQYVKLSAEWWQWAFSFRTINNPLFDETGAKGCLGEQDPGNIFFLSTVLGAPDITVTVNRSIKVPSGSHLFIPVLGSLADDPSLTLEQLYEAAGANNELVTEIHANIDGRPVRDLRSYRVRSGPFCYTLPPNDNIFGLDDPLSPYACPAGFCICRAVSDGFWLLLTPLPPGAHTVNFGGTYGPPINFTFDVTYNITVEPRGHYQGCT